MPPLRQKEDTFLPPHCCHWNVHLSGSSDIVKAKMTHSLPFAHPALGHIHKGKLQECAELSCTPHGETFRNYQS